MRVIFKTSISLADAELGKVYNSMKPVRWYNYIEVAVISIIATLALTFIFEALGLTETRTYSEIAQRQFYGHSSFAETIGLYCIVSPVVEELIFRFGIFNLLLMIIRRLGIFNNKNVHLSVWITALLFGIYHMNLVQGLYAFLMGLVITYSYAVYRKFSIPVVAHICANATALFITYIF